MNSLELPRTLTIELLHLAQKSPGACGVIARSDAGWRVVPFPETRDAKTLGRKMHEIAPGLDAKGESVFASWEASDRSAPDRAFIELVPGRPHLVVSLQTRGVLELCGWHFNNGVSEPVEVHSGD